MKALPSNIDYEQQGYLLKTAFLHFLRPLPKWVQEVHKGYFDDSPVDAQKLETRDKAAKPENIVKELEKKASSHQSVHAPEYIPYTAAQFGAILKAFFFFQKLRIIIGGKVYSNNGCTKSKLPLTR
jgi:hypothetical protein